MPADLRDELQTTLGPAYSLDRELGGGGMSRVFLARDTRLGRRVVVKVVNPGPVGSISITRFQREITMAAQLQHPHVVPVLAAGQTAGGLPYYTMPFIDGPSLRARLDLGLLPLGEAVGILRDVAKALAYAHERGVVHRDIKPENVLLAGGAAVVTDFGIAKALSGAREAWLHQTDEDGLYTTLTNLGIALGTPRYMAPEQAMGDPNIDHRADLYAWGVVAYEALAGRHPFAGKRSSEMIAAHLTETPAPLARARPDVPPVLAELVARCLAKQPAGRPADAAELLGVLDSAAAPAGWAFTPESGPRAAAATPARAELAAVAVLPFANLSPDPENDYFADGITDEIMSALARGGSIRVAGRASAFALKGRRVDLRAVGEQLRVGAVVEGSVRRAGSRLRVTAQLTSVDDGFLLWSERYDRDLTDVLAVQDEIAQAVAAALRGALAGRTPPPPQTRAAARGPANIEAYELYLKGRLSLERQTEGVARAREYLEQAVRLDPEFAPVHAGLARVHSQLGAFAIRPAGEAFPRARAAAERALALDDALPEAHAILGMTLAVHEWDWARAEPHLSRSIALDPGLSLPRQYRALSFAVWRRLDEAVAEGERAVRNDPLSLSAHHALVTYLTLGRRYDEAIAAAQRAFDLNPRPATILMFYGIALVGAGRSDEGTALLEELTALPLPTSLPPYFLAAAYAAAGRAADLRRLRDELVDRATRTWVSPFALSFVHWCVGEHGDAEGWLRRALHQRDFLPSWSHALAPLDEYRADPRLAPLLAQVGSLAK